MTGPGNNWSGSARDESHDPLDLREEWGGPGYGGVRRPDGGTVPMPPERPSSPYEAPRRQDASPPPPAGTGGRVRVRGIARDSKMRTEPQGKKEILTFRIERYDAGGNRLTPVPVEMRRYRRGTLTDGDEVEVSGRRVRGTVRARRIRNLTTASEVRASGFSWVKWAAIAAGVLIVAGGVYIGVTAAAGNFSLAGFGGAARSALPTPGLAVPPVSGVPQQSGGSSGGGASSGGGSSGGGSTATAVRPPRTSKEQPPVVDPPPPQAEQMPNLVGQSGDAAANALKAQGYSVSVVEEPNSQVAAGAVTGTDPAAGSSLSSGAAVTIYVSSGDVPPTT